MSYKEAPIRPPMLNGSNYAFWKTGMMAYIKGLDDKAWRNVIVKWTPPHTVDDEGRMIVKDEISWTDEEDRASASNSRALNAIFAAVEPNVYALISQYVTAKEAWDTLHVAFDGIDKVKETRLQQLTSRFEGIRMGEEETITEFNSRLMTISNEAHALGEPISMEKLVKKALRSLSSKFAMHKIAITQTHDLKTLTLAELMGELESYECEMINDGPPKKVKSLALKGKVRDEDEESDEEHIAMMTRQFGRFMRRMGKKPFDTRHPPR